jgi:tetratricopeptide (TPR) repeat protein
VQPQASWIWKIKEAPNKSFAIGAFELIVEQIENHHFITEVTTFERHNNRERIMSAAKHEATFSQTVCQAARKTLENAERDLARGGPVAALARGRVFELVGYFDAAAAAYREAFSLDPKLSEARAREALCHLKGGDAERGLQLAVAAAAADEKLQLETLATGEAFSVMTILGDALVANNRLDDALAAFKKARAIVPNDNYATAHLAQVYLATNQQNLAADLAPSIQLPSRFETFKTVLGLGGNGLALLQEGRRGSLVANIKVMMPTPMPGRPMDVHGEQRVASLVEPREDWCAELSAGSDG